MLTKIDDLKEEPVVGRYYLVPCVRVDRQAGMTGGFPSGLWPVIGPLHDDLDDLDFHPRHWHLDCRFLTVSQYNNVTLHGVNEKRVFGMVLCKTGLYGQRGVPQVSVAVRNWCAGAAAASRSPTQVSESRVSLQCKSDSPMPRCAVAAARTETFLCSPCPGSKEPMM